MIHFGSMELADAERWPDLIAIVRAKVKPERDANNRAAYRDRWWWFGERRPALYASIRRRTRCLACSAVTKHFVIAPQPTDRVFSHNVNVFVLEQRAGFTVLQSRVHEAWARLLSATLEERLNYRTSDCFETFPFPTPDPRALPPTLDAPGERLYTARARYMVETDQGLTKTYNRLKDPTCLDPAIVALRRLHEDLDRAVLAGYREHAGWPEIAVPPYGTPTTPAEERAVEAFEDEVIDRLFQLNAERAAAERAGAAGTAKSRKASATKRRPAKKRAPPEAGKDLFERA